MKEYRKKGIYLIPNLFTTGNLFSGFFAIISVFNDKYIVAAIAILIAIIFDSLDGKVARITKTTSQFGIEYDSLSDLVSFGIAPGLLIYSWALNSYGRIGWIAVFLFVACGALRLARFNVQISTVENKHFIGFPIPSAAGIIATTVLLDNHFMIMGKEIKPIMILIITYSLAFLMVSNIRYRNFKELRLKDRKPFNFLVGSVLILILFVAEPQIMLFGFFSLYALSGIGEKPLRLLVRKMFRRDASEPEKEIEDLEDLEDNEIVIR
ncbi:MAG: CDP-diacylglycerol--serine O-phosphatidyltransferase [Nitrospirota bacterium]